MRDIYVSYTSGMYETLKDPYMLYMSTYMLTYMLHIDIYVKC